MLFKGYKVELDIKTVFPQDKYYIESIICP